MIMHKYAIGLEVDLVQVQFNGRTLPLTFAADSTTNVMDFPREIKMNP